ncbi:MAG: hypothetical protein ACI86H_001489 [bacterium]|jgi:uncharacterized protein with ParB-like and HNH nuclease domain
MKATETALVKLLQAPRQFVVPIYQRTYSWTIKNCEQLWNDVLRVGKNSEQKGHFIGSVVYIEEGFYTTTEIPKLLIIDGQQRLTTITLLIAALAQFVQKNPTSSLIQKKIENYYLFNADEDDNLRYKLFLTQTDRETLIKLLDSAPLPSSPSKKILENFNFFLENLTLANHLEVYEGLKKLLIVDVTLKQGEDNPQLIFESLNSTGLALTQADLIRNFILMGQEITIQNSLYRNYWFPIENQFGGEYSLFFDSFIRDYLTLKMGEVYKKSLIYQKFKEYVELQAGSIESAVQEIYHYAVYYARIVFLQEQDYDLFLKFRDIKQVKIDVAHPFFMRLYSLYEEHLLSKNDFLEIIILIESYIFRRSACGIPTTRMSTLFLSLLHSLKKGNYVNQVKYLLLTAKNQRRFPKNTEFITALMIKDIYHFRNRKYLLEKLENFERKETISIGNYTIEHIVPQNLNLSQEWQEELGDDWGSIQEIYLHTIGNLTLTAYNSELSDHSFTKKKAIEGGFNESPLHLNSFLGKVDYWNESNINKRAKELANIAIQIWKYPSVKA